MFNTPDLIDGLLEDGAFIGFHGQRAHVREVSGYQLSELLYVDVLLLAPPLLIVALVAITEKTRYVETKIADSHF